MGEVWHAIDMKLRVDVALKSLLGGRSDHPVRLERLRPEIAERDDFRRGEGCDSCHATGYRGRMGVYELLELDENASRALGRGNPDEYQRAARAAPGYRPLVETAMDAALEGRTTLAEVFRIAGELGGAS